MKPIEAICLAVIVSARVPGPRRMKQGGVEVDVGNSFGFNFLKTIVRNQAAKLNEYRACAETTAVSPKAITKEVVQHLKTASLLYSQDVETKVVVPGRRKRKRVSETRFQFIPVDKEGVPEIRENQVKFLNTLGTDADTYNAGLSV